MIRRPLAYYDKLYLYAKNLEQGKYQDLKRLFRPISTKVGCKVLECSNDSIMPISELEDASQKIVVLDDYVCQKNQTELINYFLQGRHRNCSVIYLSQSFYKTPREIRLITRELNVSKEQYDRATNAPYDFLYVDKPLKRIRKEFYGRV